jgi:hypothetical protein
VGLVYDGDSLYHNDPPDLGPFAYNGAEPEPPELPEVSTTAITANIFLMSNGSSDFGNGVIYSNLVIQGNDTYILEQERLLLNDGDFLAGNVGSSATFDNLLVATLSYTSI